MREVTLLPPARPLPAAARELRSAVRGFLAAERAAGRFVPACDAWLSGWDESFSRRLAGHGWIGMTIPPEYGGPGRSPLDRYVVVEELLAAGAPVAAHWVCDRQIAPNLLRYGSEELKRRYLPAIARGECYFAIGLSEPDAGSDLAAVRTAGVRADGGWIVSGVKIWTSGAHRAHALIALLRTGPPDGRQRHVGLSQLLIELDQPGVTIRPLAGGEAPEVAAALVKDVGTRLENEIIEVARMLAAAEPDPGDAGYAGLLAHAILHAPGFTIRGGTNEILRTVVARGLGLR